MLVSQLTEVCTGDTHPGSVSALFRVVRLWVLPGLRVQSGHAFRSLVWPLTPSLPSPCGGVAVGPAGTGGAVSMGAGSLGSRRTASGASELSTAGPPWRTCSDLSALRRRRQEPRTEPGSRGLGLPVP